MTLLSLFVTNTVLVMLLVGLTLAFHAFMPRPARSKVIGAELPFLSVIIPARDEEENIGGCLRSLVAQDYPKFEIVVIDDRSTDATANIVKELAEKDSRVRYVEKTEPPPPGWTGKCSALKEAVEHASGDWFLFLDADTRQQPNSLRPAVSFALANKAHMASFWPLHELGSFGERLITPTLWGSFFWSDPFHLVNDLSSDKAYSIGHCILIDRRAYTMVGGHQSVREWIIEDHALAKMVKYKGLNVQMADGRHLFKVRMYTSLEGVWHGWTKMLFSLAEYRLLNVFFMLLFINSTLLMPFVQATMVAGMWLTGMASPEVAQLTALAGLQLVLALVWFLRISTHFHGLRWWCFPLLPASALIVTVAYLYSAYLVLTGAQVRWRGRAYTVTRLKLPDGR